MAEKGEPVLSGDLDKAIERLRRGEPLPGELQERLVRLLAAGPRSHAYQESLKHRLQAAAKLTAPSPGKDPDPRVRLVEVQHPPLGTWVIVADCNPNTVWPSGLIGYPAFSPEEQPVLGQPVVGQEQTGHPLHQSSVVVRPQTAEFSMALAVVSPGAGVGVVGSYPAQQNVALAPPWAGTGISASLAQLCSPTQPLGRFKALKAQVTLVATHIAESIYISSSSKASEASRAAVTGGITVNFTLVGLAGAATTSVSSFEWFLDRTSLSGAEVVSYSPLNGGATMTVSVDTPYDGRPVLLLVQIILDVTCAVGAKPSKDSMGIFDMRFNDDSLIVVPDGVFSTDGDTQAQIDEASCPLQITEIKILGEEMF
jgi:hypothetical protein